MEFVQPDTYTNQVGTLALIIAIVCLLLSFLNAQKGHGTKLFSIMLVASLALFSSHWGTYFAAIFIVATAVTELEFLQNLAAIIRKDENYFKYRKEAFSKEEAIKRKVQEEIEEEISTELPKGHANHAEINLLKLSNLSRSESMRLYFDVQEKALSYASQEFGEIERDVRLRNNGKMVEYDGLSSGNKIFEVKWSRGNKPFPLMISSLRKINIQIERHKEITGKSPEFYIILVTNTKSDLTSEHMERLYKRANEQDVKLRVYDLREIGFEVTGENT